MRTNIDIDDKLMKQAMKATGAATKKAAVETALRKMVELRKQEGIKKWFGRIEWDGDLAAMREGRLPEWEAGRKKAKREEADQGEAEGRKTVAAG